MNALARYHEARDAQRRAEAEAARAQAAADAWLLVLRNEVGYGRPAGPDRLAKLVGEGRSSVAKRLERARKGTPRPRGGVRR